MLLSKETVSWTFIQTNQPASSPGRIQNMCLGCISFYFGFFLGVWKQWFLENTTYSVKAKYMKILQAWVGLNSVFPCLEALSEALLLCGNYETGVSFEMVTSTLRSSFFTQNLRGMTFLEILNKFFFCIMCSKANILPEVSQRKGMEGPSYV